MPDIPNFWIDGGPHEPIKVEESWRAFVRQFGGTVVEDILPQPRNFENADFLFSEASVVAELKEIETEFSRSSAFRSGYSTLMQRVVSEDSSWRPSLFGGDGSYPRWFMPEFVRLFRPPLSRILKKANRQLRETKAYFKVQSATGVLLLVNDGFRSIAPNLIRAQTSELLLHSFTSIDCCVLLTVNRYVEVVGSDQPKILWVPTYSDRAPNELVEFIDELGRRWCDYFEEMVGQFTSRDEVGQGTDILKGSRYIVLPNDG
jgi:hypothetical protein